MAENLGIDLGTGSIGLAKRNSDLGFNVIEQLEYYSALVFKRGVGKGKSGEISFAAERTKHRSTRRLYQARKYRIWETLDVLIKNGCCPLSIEGLEKWRRYDKAKGQYRNYPVEELRFEQWVRLDFNNDGKPEYTSPYQLRAELATKQIDLHSETNKFKLGRVLYHIAQRRGFKSSKGETIKDQEQLSIDKGQEYNSDSDHEVSLLKKSEENKSKDLAAFQELYNLPTVGCAFAKLENEGIRIRESIYQAVRSQYVDEIGFIFDFQQQLSRESILFKEINHSIFYKRPLRSQKGLVGKCTMEPHKTRCPISHPEFEKFRAWSFINNIRYKIIGDKEERTLTQEQKEKLFEDKFMRVKSSFKFEEIRIWIEKGIGHKIENKRDRTNVEGCPISSRFKNLFGDNWQNINFISNEVRRNKYGVEHTISYSIEDIWHVCFSFDDEERLVNFAKSELIFNEKETKSLINIWAAMPQGYSMLSLKAIRCINSFLLKGFPYTEAVLMAKLPEILGTFWQDNEGIFTSSISKLIIDNKQQKLTLNIVNSLISNYKSLELTDRKANRNYSYLLTDTDLSEISNFIKTGIGEITWAKLDDKEREFLVTGVSEKYQSFFSGRERDYYKLPKLGDTIKKFLSDNFEFLYCENEFVDKHTGLPCSCSACKKMEKLYHPSQIEFYKPASDQTIIWNDIALSIKLLGSPVIGAFKNPVAMRTLHILRKSLNHLLKEGIINEDTRIVVELARDLNDSNMRWAIEAYQKEREKENKFFEETICELFNRQERIVSDEEIDKLRMFIEQCEITNEELIENSIDSVDKSKKIERNERYKKDITRYRLWLEQGCRCIYTGKVIRISDLFNENLVDFEHTIPRSQSFDNSLANLTICDAYYNRVIKKKRIPTQLENYDKDAVINGILYTSITPRLQKWIEKKSRLEENANNWKFRAKQAQTKDLKDEAIRQFHMWKMELDYWRNKIERFRILEVKSGFINSQLVDTRIISKYALHYLKSVFTNVEIQKGSVTSDFRKMLGVQNESSKKNRDKHSHHAIDASILTLIPTSAKRDRMLKIFYEIEENRKLNEDVTSLQKELRKEIESCKFGSVKGLSNEIESNILINHISRDRVLNKSKRKARKRGKEILIEGKNGEYNPKWIKGDCIRGQIHGDTFYGALKIAERNELGKIIRNVDCSLKLGEKIFYVVRRPIKFKKNPQDSGFTDWNDLEARIVDKSLYKILKKQHEGIPFSIACENGFYMKDCNGVSINRIRHIRCFASITNPVKVKSHSYLSKNEYKQSFYAEIGDLYVLCKYSNEIISEFVIYSLYDITQNRRNNLDDIPLSLQSKKGDLLKLEHIIKSGSHILLYEKIPEEVKELDLNLMLRRLYVVTGFESDGKRIILKRHINAQDDKTLGKGVSIKNFNELPERIRCGVNTIRYLLENIDFKITFSNKIEFL